MACGGGSGGGGGGGGTATPTPGPVTLYVRPSGNDDETGTTPERALRTVLRAAQLVAPGTTVIVAPGTYGGRIQIENIDTTDATPIQLIANPAGDLTGDEPGEVVIDAQGEGAAVRIASTPFVTLDGFVITGAATTGIRVLGSSTNTVIRNCVINNNNDSADGIIVQNSSDVLIFNNLIVDNDRGIVMDGSAAARIINNTVFDNARTGIFVSGMNPSGTPSTDATVVNNVVQENRNMVSIAVGEGPTTSRQGYVGDFNLAFEPDFGDQSKTYRPTVIQGENDVNEDALFVDAGGGDFHLSGDSPALDAGTDDIDDELRAALFQRSTRSNDQLDSEPVDLGYHYPVLPSE
jgi:parallel beta-helix repeat protein